MKPIVRLNDAPFDIDRFRPSVALRLDSDERRVIPEALDGEEVVFERSNAYEIRISRSDSDVIERSEPFADLLSDGPSGEPLVHRKLRITDGVGVRFDGVAEQPTLRMREDLRLGELNYASHRSKFRRIGQERSGGYVSTPVEGVRE